MPAHARFAYFGDRRSLFMRRLFRQWHRTMDDFSEVLHDDLPYWYGERTSIGVLTAAALRLRGKIIALEEYSVRRGGVRVNRAGRADLYVYDSSADRSYEFEFKVRYCSFGWDAMQRVRSAMREAVKDVRSLPKPVGRSQGVAVTFVIPYLAQMPAPEKWQSLWKDFLRFVSEPSTLNADFVAVHRATDEVLRRATDNWGFNPGVAAVGKVVRRTG